MKLSSCVVGVLFLLILVPLSNYAGEGDHSVSEPEKEVSHSIHSRERWDEIPLQQISIQIDEGSLTEEQREVLDREVHPQDLQDPLPPEQVQLDSVRRFHQVMNVVSDLVGMGAATLVPVSSELQNSTILRTGVGMIIGSFTIDAFRPFPEVIQQIRNNPVDLRSLCFYGATVGQLGAISGFSTIIAGAPIEIGAWTATGSLLVKLTSMAIQMRYRGINSPFGGDPSEHNPRTIENMVFRVGFLSGFGTLGGILLAVSATVNSPELGKVGSYMLGLSIFIGTADVLYQDVEVLRSPR